MNWLAFLKPVEIWLEHKKEKSKAEHTRDLAVINNQARLAQSEVDHNSAWEMASLKSENKGLKYFSYAMITLPILITVIVPERGALIWTNLETAPKWIVQTWIGITGGVWGIANLKNAIPSMTAQVLSLASKKKRKITYE